MSEATKSKREESGERAPEPREGPVPAVSRTFALGWQMARLYRQVAYPSRPLRRKNPSALPGLGKLSPGQRTEVSVMEVEATLGVLADQFAATGMQPPTTEGLRDALQVSPRGSQADIKRQVLSLHVSVLGHLTAVDFRLGKSYGLGRALAETAHVETLTSLARRLNEHRLEEIKEWLADLSSALPPHAGRATYLSLEEWGNWWQSEPPNSWAPKDKARQALVRQGRVWRALLSGEKKGTDMLSIEKYTAAADRLVAQGRKVTVNLLRRYKWVAIAVAAVVILALAFALFYDGAGRALVALGAAAAALGVTWKGVGSLLSGLADQLSKPLWDAELDRAIAEAITILPEQGPPIIDAAALPPVGPDLAPPDLP